jgi:hypothetical protein
MRGTLSVGDGMNNQTSGKEYGVDTLNVDSTVRRTFAIPALGIGPVPR